MWGQRVMHVLRLGEGRGHCRVRELDGGRAHRGLLSAYPLFKAVLWLTSTCTAPAKLHHSCSAVCTTIKRLCYSCQAAQLLLSCMYSYQEAVLLLSSCTALAQFYAQLSRGASSGRAAADTNTAVLLLSSCTYHEGCCRQALAHHALRRQHRQDPAGPHGSGGGGSSSRQVKLVHTHSLAFLMAHHPLCREACSLAPPGWSLQAQEITGLAP